MPRLHIFNPEHDISLPYSPGAFTPTRGVRAMKSACILQSALYADKGDFIMIPEDCKDKELSVLPFYPDAIKGGMNIVAGSIDNSLNISSVIPWGWDAKIVKELRDRGVKRKLLPSDEELEDIKRLSHRRTSKLFHRYFHEASDFLIVNEPNEFFTAEEALSWARGKKMPFFKAPWSSSGYGVFALQSLTDVRQLERIKNIISTQGSIMGEENYPHHRDMATEWVVTQNGAEFCGYSVFEASEDGRYKGNMQLPQKELERLIKKELPVGIDKIIELQSQAINKIISSSYRGPIGIDILVAEDGRVNLCVEVNLRMTMGHVALLRDKKIDLSKYEFTRK